tara:strand:- start:216 stop:1169 length:954 start_codon:yes stop_codon:yes gene_type:complete
VKKVSICTTSRNHLRFLIPIIKTLTKNALVLLYCNFSELKNDSLISHLNQCENLKVCDLTQKDEFNSFIVDANSLLVTTGSNSPYHKFEFDLCNSVSCKTFTIQHGLSQDGITRIDSTYFSADHVLTWIKKDLIPETVATPRDKFISVGVPNHYYDTTERVEGSKVFFLVNGFDKPNSQDIKLDTSSGEWSGIYTLKWKEETWDTILSLSNGPCYFVRHPTCNGGSLHPKLEHLLKKDTNHLIDNSWLSKNNINRSQLYSLGSKYYITYPSSCFIDCFLRGVDYELFIDYNSNVKLFTENSLEAINSTSKICELLLT